MIDWVFWVQSFGFNGALVIYLLFRFEGKLEQNTQALNSLAEFIKQRK